MVFTVTLNPALDKTVEIADFRIDKVNRIATLRKDAGGKGINVSKTVCALGGSSCAYCVLGGQTGEQIREMLAETGIHITSVPAMRETRTNLKVIDPVRHTNTDVNEPGAQVMPQELQHLLSMLLEQTTDSDSVVLAGSLPANVSCGMYREWIDELKKNDVKVFLDADGEVLREAVQAKPYFVKPNKEELQRLCGRTLHTEKEMIQQAELLVGSGIGAVLVSLGGEGALLVTAQGVWKAKAIPVAVKSTVGAGDSMVAAFACGMEKGLDSEACLRLAVAVSAAAVSLDGTQAPEPEAVEKLLPEVRIERLEQENKCEATLP